MTPVDDLRRRSADSPIGTRVTILEADMGHLIRTVELHVLTSDRMVRELDARANKQDIAMARLLTGLSVVIVLANLLSPFLQRLVGLPS